ncbi:hypothetical protein BOSEA1005_10955 [Hyphomicrobiales bacterium]|nr:hypothetical protein BOSEA1005_10955 [Hyphomicrobiales bacterium]
MNQALKSLAAAFCHISERNFEEECGPDPTPKSASQKADFPVTDHINSLFTEKFLVFFDLDFESWGLNIDK